jgi:hypothetical protein
MGLPCFGDKFCGNGTAIPLACTNAATAQGSLNELNVLGGCYMEGNTVLIPPASGTIGNAGRGIFRGSSFKDWDLSLVKDTVFKERLTAQFRAEFFNVLNHPNIYNPTGPAGAGFNDPSAPQLPNKPTSGFGCGCNTPDQASPNPVLGTGGSRSIQLGLKLIW